MKNKLKLARTLPQLPKQQTPLLTKPPPSDVPASRRCAGGFLRAIPWPTTLAPKMPPSITAKGIPAGTDKLIKKIPAHFKLHGENFFKARVRDFRD